MTHPNWRRAPLLLLASCVLVLLYAPMVAVAALSVNRSKLGVGWRGFTWDWYARLAGNDVIREAAVNTLVLALVSTAVATVLGTLLALGRARMGRRTGAVTDGVVSLPVVTPDIMMAAALVVAFRFFQSYLGAGERGMTALVVGHVTFQLSFVALTVGARLKSLGPDLAEAARDLYASPWYRLTRVTLPLLAPGIIAGALLAFTLSVDDFVITFFLKGAGQETLPTFIYASVKRGVTPEVHALSTLITAATVALVLAARPLMAKGAGG